MRRRLEIARGLVHEPRHILSRRAYDRARPRLARRRLGDAFPPQARARPDDPCHDALHGRGRQAMRPGRHRRPWKTRGARLPGQAEGVGAGQGQPHAGRRLRALHGNGAARRPSEPGRLPDAVEAGEMGREGFHDPHLGHHRARSAPLPPKPGAHGHVHGHAAGAAGGARLRVWRQDQESRDRRRRPGPRRAGLKLHGDVPGGGGQRPHLRHAAPTSTRRRRFATCARAASTGSSRFRRDFSREVLAGASPRVAFVEDNTDQFSASAVEGVLPPAPVGLRPEALRRAPLDRRVPGDRRGLSVRSLYPVPPSRARSSSRSSFPR